MNFRYTKHVGKIKFYNEGKAYGFITCNETGKDYFFSKNIAVNYGITERHKNYDVQFEVSHNMTNHKAFVHNVSEIEK